MRTKKEQEAIRGTQPKALSPSDQALFDLLTSAANDDETSPDLFAGLAQSHADTARLRAKRLILGPGLWER